MALGTCSAGLNRHRPVQHFGYDLGRCLCPAWRRRIISAIRGLRVGVEGGGDVVGEVAALGSFGCDVRGDGVADGDVAVA